MKDAYFPSPKTSIRRMTASCFSPSPINPDLLPEYPLFQAGFDGLIFNQVDFSRQQVFQFMFDGDELQQADLFAQFDQDIHVAVGGSFAFGKRTKYAGFGDPAPGKYRPGFCLDVLNGQRFQWFDSLQPKLTKIPKPGKMPRLSR